MPIITLKNVSISFGNDHVLESADLTIEKGDRICLTGRNGAGKSTLMRLVSSELPPDEGDIWRQDNLVCATLEQELPRSNDLSVFQTVAESYADIGELLTEYHHLTNHLKDDGNVDRLSQLQEKIEAANGWSINHNIESVLDRMDLDPDKSLRELSGGWVKRVAIAKSLVTKPDVWLLDEPTNHLDIPTIQWLEEQLLSFEGTIVFVTHDRQLMQSVARSIIDIDHGKVVRWDCDYRTFVTRRDAQREVEEKRNKRFDDKLKKEESWIRQGIKARRTRNAGRVRSLERLREERARRKQQKHLKMEIDAGIASGKIVKELINVSKAFDQERVIEDFSLIVQRQDRIGLIGPNGIGKSTLIKVLLNDLEVDQGQIRTGTRLEVAYFDQARDQLDPELSVADYISEGREFVSIGGKDIHVVGYLANFMFSGDQSRAPIRTLSGGEQNRLLLARLFSLPANLLVLDEPTNDLDVESLELLEELLLDFKGTVLIVSHDRSFMDNVVSSLLIFEGHGSIVEFVGGYSDWIREGGKFFEVRRQPDKQTESVSSTAISHSDRKMQRAENQKLKRELLVLPETVEVEEETLAGLHRLMSSDDFYQRPLPEQRDMVGRAEEVQTRINSLMDRWETLEKLLD